ncbi:MAG: hypothetical protein ABSG95_06850 [Solirubrobacteraceae bacterium]|jgi:hypothetical protein
MATTNSNSRRSTQASAKANGAKAATRRTRSTGRETTRSKATQAKASRTRATHQTEAALRQNEIAARNTAVVVGDYAERAVLIPVGAALIARDRVVSSVNETISSYSSTSKAQAQLRRFERRGVTARNRLEREVRKTRVRFERDLRQRRREIGKTVTGTVNELEARRDAVTKNSSELASQVQERILSLV